MKVQNLSQLKKAFASGHDFKIIEHFNRPECNGQIRHITKLQTNGFYSVIKDDPDNRWSKANDGLGAWCEFGTLNGQELLIYEIDPADNRKHIKYSCSITHIYGKLVLQNVYSADGKLYEYDFDRIYDELSKEEKL